MATKINPEVNVFTGALGLNNRLHGKRLANDKGMIELASAWNVDITDQYAIQRRCGRTKKSSGVFHSLFRGLNNQYYAIRDNDLVSFIHPDELTVVATLGNAKMYFANAGEYTYFSNGTVLGTLQDGVLGSWDKNEYAGPDTDRVFSSAPSGKFLCYHSGIMYIAVDSFIYHSEPFAPGLWDYANNYLAFNQNVSAIWGVDNTLFVSTTEGVYSHVGDSPLTFVQRFVHEGEAFHNTVQSVIGFADKGKGSFVTTKKGICFSGANGYFTNLTKDRINIPAVGSGGAFYNNHKYVCSLT